MSDEKLPGGPAADPGSPDTEPAADGGTKGTFSRRDFLKTGTAGLIASAFSGSSFAASYADTADSYDRYRGEHGTGDSDLALVNGKFVDGRGVVGSMMVIQGGRITSMNRLSGLGPNARIINLRGRTVIPGLINVHVHHSRTGNNPGYETRRIETVFSIRELQEELAKRARTVPPGKFIGCHLGWHYVQLAEGRPPTLAELDEAAPDHAVFLSGRAGWVEPFFSVTNSLGKPFFEAAGLAVDPVSGRISGTPEQAFAAIQATETDEDKVRQTWDNNAWSLSNGVTMVLDPAGNPNRNDYKPIELWRKGLLHVRHRLNFSAGNADQVEARASNMVFRGIGDDYLRAVGFGESIGNRAQLETTFEPVARKIAEYGWKLQNHTDFYDQVDIQLDAIERIHQEFPVDQLRWQLIHAFQVTAEQLQRMKSLGVGLDLENERYLDRIERNGGPFFRLIVDSGINIGIGTDGSNFAPNNPWLMMYYMTTGVNVRGIPENADQAITRLEALRLFTAGSAFQTFDEDRLGSFEVGKLADLAVLSDDFLTVSDADLRRITSVMTIVGGKVVHTGSEPNWMTG